MATTNRELDDYDRAVFADFDREGPEDHEPTAEELLAEDNEPPEPSELGWDPYSGDFVDTFNEDMDYGEF